MPTPRASITYVAETAPANADAFNLALDQIDTAIALESAAAAHYADTSTHGVTGAIVGISDTQTLTNKLMSTGSVWNGTALVVAYLPTGASTIALGTVGTTGSAATVLRTDATIVAFDATNPSTQAVGDAAVVGSAAFAARRDHKHAISAAVSATTLTASSLTSGRVAIIGAAGLLTDDADLTYNSGSNVLTAVNGSFTNDLTAITLNVTGAIAGGSSIKSDDPTAGIGYATGAGGAVVQGTSKTTTVALSTVCGQITMHAANLPANTAVQFSLTNSAIAVGDVLVVSHNSVTFMNSYAFNSRCAGGAAAISVRNVSGGDLAEAVTMNFALIKAVTA